MDVKDLARFYIQRGWAVVPIAAGSKGADTADWLNVDFRPEDFREGDNVGIKTGKPSGGLVDVDLDMMEAVTAAPFLLPATAMRHGRPSKPESHWWYSCPEASRTLKWKDVDDASIIELRADNAQTVVPRSVHPSGEQLAWVEDGAPAAQDLETLKRACAAVATAALVAKRYPGSGSRHDFTLALAGTLLRCGLSGDEVVKAVVAAARAARDDNWKDREREAKDTATRFREEGEQAALTAGKRLAELWGDQGQRLVARLKAWWLGDQVKKSEDKISAINERHAVVFQQSGDVIVVTEDYDDMLKRHYLRYSSFADFQKLYPEKVTVGTKPSGEPIVKALGAWWLEHGKRRLYQGLEFRPEGGRPDYLNLWKGFKVAPEPGDWSMFRDHIREIVCAGDGRIFEYVLAWMAAAVQKPGRPAETAIAMRGGQGSGKGTFAVTFGSLFGQHFAHLDSSRHLTGNFNAHLHDAVLVFADEAAWPGDKAAAGTLKRLITEPTIAIERKGVDVFTVPNVIHLLLASNESWVVPAGIDDRRFCVLDVADVKANDHRYFGEIKARMDAGGLAAMLHDLLAHDVSTVNLRKPPQTAALLEQKIIGMDPWQRWWYDKLCDGRLSTGERWPARVAKDVIYADYLEATKAMGYTRHAGKQELVTLLKKMLPEGWPRARRALVKGQNVREWELPSLAEARAHFDRMLKRPAGEWPDDGAIDGADGATGEGERHEY